MFLRMVITGDGNPRPYLTADKKYHVLARSPDLAVIQDDEGTEITVYVGSTDNGNSCYFLPYGAYWEFVD